MSEIISVTERKLLLDVRGQVEDSATRFFKWKAANMISLPRLLSYSSQALLFRRFVFLLDQPNAVLLSDFWVK